MIKRITALLTALTVSLAFTSCELRSKSSSSEAEDTTELATFREEKEKETEHWYYTKKVYKKKEK